MIDIFLSKSSTFEDSIFFTYKPFHVPLLGVFLTQLTVGEPSTTELPNAMCTDLIPFIAVARMKVESLRHRGSMGDTSDTILEVWCLKT